MNSHLTFAWILVPLFQAVLTASWQGSLVIGLVLLARRAFGGRVPARWHYLLWLLVLTRLLVPASVQPHNPASMENLPVLTRPFIPAWQEELPNSRRTDSTVAPRRALPVVDKVDQSRFPTEATAASPTLPRSAWVWAALTWLGGVLAFGAWFLLGSVGLYRRMRRETRSADDGLTALWQASCRRWLHRPPPRVRVAGWMDCPALIGLWRPTLLIPRRALDSFSPGDWEHVFAHEIAHLRWRDHWTQVFLLLTWGVHWFNPVVWVGLRRLRADRELAADEWVLRRLDDDRALAYGETLFKTLAGRPAGLPFHPGMVGISEDGAQMANRLRRITAFLPRRGRGSLAGLAVGLALGTVVFGQGSSPSPSPTDKALEKSSTPSAKPSTPLLPATPQGLRDALLAAARLGDAGRVTALLNASTAPPSKFSERAANRLLDEVIGGHDLTAFTTLHDTLKKTTYGRSWQPSDDLLGALVREGRTDFIDALLSRRLDPARLAPLVSSADQATRDWLDCRLAEVTKQRADFAALQKAADEGDLPAIRRLLDAGEDVNGVGLDDNTPLLRAVFKDQLAAARLLLERGALPDKPRFPGWDYTPLCLVGSVPMAELLKQAGGDIHAKLWGRDVGILCYVAMFGKPEVVEWFLQQGLNPRMFGDHHQNLLVDLKEERTAKLLLDAGVDPNNVDEFGRTPLCSARNAGVAQALIDRGAKLTGLRHPLILDMIYGFAAAGAMEAALKAGADHDPATLQEALSRVERWNQQDYPEREGIRQLLLAYGAKPTPASEVPVAQINCKIEVSAVDNAFVGDGETTVHDQSSFDQAAGARSMGGSAKVEADGNATHWIPENAITTTFAVERFGYATLYAGPFTPPTRENLANLSLTLTKGFGAIVEIMDEAGRPVAGARLKGYYPGPPRLDYPATVSDAAGRAALKHVGAAPLNLQVMADGYQADEIDDVHLNPTEPHRWTLRKAPSLSGVVVSAGKGQPIAGARIKLAGARGPHDETYADPATAPLLATSDAEGRFVLASLRPDSHYSMFVEAPGYGGVLLDAVTSAQAGLRVILGPELFVRGKVLHVSPAQLFDGKLTVGYYSFYDIGGKRFAAAKNVSTQPKNGEAEFSIESLYDYSVEIYAGDKIVKLDAADLPKSDLVIDLAAPAP